MISTLQKPSLPTRASARASLPRKVLLAALAVLFLALPGTPQAEASSNIGRCSYETARVLGWVWADGKYNESSDDFFFRTKSGAVARHMVSILNDLDLDYRSGQSKKGHDRYRIELPGYDESFMYDDPMQNPAISCRPDAFLASVIEAEANKQGLILDDPTSARRDAITSILDGMNIDSTDSGFKVKADRADWSKFRSLPMIACGRIPGGDVNCSLGQAR